MVAFLFFLLSRILVRSRQTRSLAALELAREKSPGLGARIDIVLTMVRVGFFFNDIELITGNLPKAAK